MRGVRWGLVYTVIVVAVWLLVAVALDGSWLWGAIFALCSVSLAFSAAEWIRRRRIGKNR